MKFDIPADKAKHALVGAVIALLAALLISITPLAAYWRSAALGAALAAGIAKELLDWVRNRRLRKAGLLPQHGVERADVFATFAGGVLIAGVPNGA